MSDEQARIREALAAEKPQPGELHDAAIRKAMRATAAQLAATPVTTVRRRNPLPAALAAALVLAMGGFWAVKLYKPEPDVMRGGAADPSALLPADGAELSAAPDRLRWPPQTGATTYLLTLRDAGGSVIWRSEPTTRAEAILPPEVRSRITGGRQYLWSVSVSGLADVNELGPYAFRLR
jgi:hypothetical protein